MNEFYKLYANIKIEIDIDAVWKAREIEQNARNAKNFKKLMTCKAMK